MNYDIRQADAIEWLRQLPDDHADLLLTSPPYELARTYGIGERMQAGQAWVDWMVEVIRAAAPKVKGLIAVVCEGQTRKYRYSCVPFLLMADLHRAGFNLRKPCVFERDGIPGSGGRDWLKNRWEPIVCVTRPGKLPWSENTACGAAPKYRPGGRPSYRRMNGQRVNMKAPNGIKNGDTNDRRDYNPPVLANPGNVIRCKSGGRQMGHDLAHENEAPFPLRLAEFFVRSFCPPLCCTACGTAGSVQNEAPCPKCGADLTAPGATRPGLVIDPFAGSGTTGHAALANGRRFEGCDIRASQVGLTRRRLESGITPDMFAAAGGGNGRAK